MDVKSDPKELSPKDLDKEIDGLNKVLPTVEKALEEHKDYLKKLREERKRRKKE